MQRVDYLYAERPHIGKVVASYIQVYAEGCRVLPANDSGKLKLREISRNNISRKVQFEELLEDSRSELI